MQLHLYMVADQNPGSVVRCAWLLLLGLLWVSPRLPAAEHPVPLANNFDPAQCVTCHADKTKGKFVHSAVAMGCDACHAVKREGEVTSVSTTAQGTALCIQCHASKDSTRAKGKVHEPVTEDCTKCHSPHSSPYKFQLLKARSGGKADNLCLTCHDKGVDIPPKGSRHPALDLGCDTCHVTHKTGPEGKKEFEFHLVKAPPALCLDCHDANQQRWKEAHRNQPAATADCTGCHDPHQSSSPKLLQKYVHPPFAEKMCDVCHQAPKDGKVVLNQDGKFELCYNCHDDIKALVEKSKVQHPAFSVIDRCTECHTPHASLYPRLLKQSPVATCETCHVNRADEHKHKKFLHQPAFKDGCYYCHQPHGSSNPRLLRTEQVNDTCLTCHNSTPKVVSSKDGKVLRAFAGKLQLPQGYLDSVKRIDVSAGGLGHPIMGHPVSGVDDPSSPGHKLQCISCHDPHASDFTPRMFRMKKDQKAICLKCHGSSSNTPARAKGGTQ